MEKKLSKDEKSIIKELMGDQENDNDQSKGKKGEEEKKENESAILSEVKEEDTIILANNAPIKNNLDEEDPRI